MVTKKSASKQKPAKMAVSKANSKKAPVKKSSPKLQIGKDALRKTEIYTYIADKAELSKKQIIAVFEALNDVIEGHLKKGGPGEFTLPGLIKCRIQRKPATKARKGTNPFTGEEMMFKAKPARNVVRVRPLKKLKEMVG